MPYRGAAQVIPTLLSGDLNFALDNLASYLPVIHEGRLRGLAMNKPGAGRASWPQAIQARVHPPAHCAGQPVRVLIAPVSAEW